MNRLNTAWASSPHKSALAQQIRDEILSQESILIDNALRLGLGTMDATRPYSNSEGSLHQLLVFETTLECLRELCLFPPLLPFRPAELNGTL